MKRQNADFLVTVERNVVTRFLVISNAIFNITSQRPCLQWIKIIFPVIFLQELPAINNQSGYYCLSEHMGINMVKEKMIKDLTSFQMLSFVRDKRKSFYLSSWMSDSKLLFLSVNSFLEGNKIRSTHASRKVNWSPKNLGQIFKILISSMLKINNVA